MLQAHSTLLLWSLGTNAGALSPLVHTAKALDSDSAMGHAGIVIASGHRALNQRTLQKVVGQPLPGGSPCLGLHCVTFCNPGACQNEARVSAAIVCVLMAHATRMRMRGARGRQ